MNTCTEERGGIAVSAFRCVAHAEIPAIGVVKDQCTDACFCIHHESVRQLPANLFRLEQLPEPRLILQIRARRIAKTVPFALVLRSEPLRHGYLWRVRESPVFAYAPVQPLRAGFRRLNPQRLQSMGFEIVAVLL